MPAVAGSRSRGERMISVRPPLSSVIDRSASTFSRPSDDERRLPVLAGGLDGVDEGCGVFRAPGNADGCGLSGGVPACPDEDDGAFEYDEAVAPEASMPMAYTSTSDSRICRRTSSTPVRLFWSLPSEISSSAFLRRVPFWAI